MQTHKKEDNKKERNSMYIRARNALALHAWYIPVYVRTYARNGSHAEIIARAIKRDCASPFNRVTRHRKTTDEIQHNYEISRAHSTLEEVH